MDKERVVEKLQELAEQAKGLRGVTASSNEFKRWESSANMIN